MNELSRRVVKLLREAGQPLSLRDIAQQLDLDKDDRRALKSEVQRLVQAGGVAKAGLGRFTLPAAATSKKPTRKPWANATSSSAG